MMIDISSAKIEKIIIHQVGNKIREEGFRFSDKEANINENLNDLLLKHYLLPLSKTNSCFQFYHESDITLNEMHQFSSRIFNNPKTFKDQSINIAKHLYSASTHPNISGGDFIVILFSDIKLNDSLSYGIATLRIENKDDYLDIQDNNGVFQPLEKSGISLTKIQKGALILSTTNVIFAIDNLGQKTKYWLDLFLKAVPVKTKASCLRAGGEILKSISTKIKETSTLLNINDELDRKIQSSDEISLKDIKDIAKKHLNSEDVDTVLTRVSEKFGFELSDDIIIESKDLLPVAKKISNKTKIDDGISLLITDKNHHIDNISVTKVDNKIQAIIDITIKE
ncbi:hypothetical protein ACN0ZT_17045 [Klebsiella pneumoniae]|uniref:nucleoid-associated protein n=1 Tax=Klebsiella TaxID=570 RepID=UPI00115E83A6|nr:MULTISPECIES: nucleoid-associated protein [Klebsiella]MCJ6183248.1 nucleoid-associated protein [Klebsiella pneumoniae]MCY0031168.1 nucleoid-associated protein [Klebsiella pneumoniae]MDI3171482.1 hypothetical protein [Klebsiella michiganensis]